MRVKFFLISILIIIISYPVFSQDKTGAEKSMGFDNYIRKIEATLPELRSNSIYLLQAENEIDRAKGAGDVSLNAGGSTYSNKQYVSMFNMKGDVKGYDYYAGLSKKITSTGTSVSATYDYTKNTYSNFGSASYTAYEPSVKVKISQPLLYNFLGKVDSYSENDAKMKHEIEKYQFQERNKSVLNSYKKLYFEWILYKGILVNLEEAIRNSNILKGQVKKKVDAGLADNDDYQGTVSSALTYEQQYTEYLTALNNVESQIGILMNMEEGKPDPEKFDEFCIKADSSNLAEKEFKDTRSAKIMDLTMKNYIYSKGVYENRLLPEFNVYSEVTKKDLSESSAKYGMNDTDYTVGFEFKYSLGNNAAESGLKDIEIKIKSLEYEYGATKNSYRKKLLNYIESSKGISEQLAKKEKKIKALESKLQTERKKYSQSRLNLSYVIDTENSITSERNNILIMKYQIIGYYLDYQDLTM